MQHRINHPSRVLFFVLLFFLLFVEGCSNQVTSTSVPLPALTVEAETPTPVQPTPTLEPMAATVDGEGIPLADFNAEMKSYQTAGTALGQDVSADQQKQAVLDDLTDQMLLAQAAKKAGFTLDDAALQQRIDTLTAQLGGAQKLTDWENTNGYDDETFRTSLQISVEAAWERDQITSQVPEVADQVHARQMLFYAQATAQSYLDQLKSGADFETLAWKVDPVTGGDLGWFPKGYLSQPEIEAAAFSLQAGEYSQIIQTKLGFQIIQVIERNAQQPLSPDARLALQKSALQKWLQDQRTQSNIQILVK